MTADSPPHECDSCSAQLGGGPYCVVASKCCCLSCAALHFGTDIDALRDSICYEEYVELIEQDDSSRLWRIVSQMVVFEVGFAISFAVAVAPISPLDVNTVLISFAIAMGMVLFATLFAAPAYFIKTNDRSAAYPLRITVASGIIRAETPKRTLEGSLETVPYFEDRERIWSPQLNPPQLLFWLEDEFVAGGATAVSKAHWLQLLGLVRKQWQRTPLGEQKSCLLMISGAICCKCLGYWSLGTHAGGVFAAMAGFFVAFTLSRLPIFIPHSERHWR